MMNSYELDEKLEEIKRFRVNNFLKKLDKKIYGLKLSEEYLSGLSQDYLIYVHVRLHNSLGYKKPFAPIKDVKKVHDCVAKFMKNHKRIDSLDD